MASGTNDPEAPLSLVLAGEWAGDLAFYDTHAPWPTGFNARRRGATPARWSCCGPQQSAGSADVSTHEHDWPGGKWDRPAQPVEKRSLRDRPMHRLTSNRMAWGLTAFLIGPALGGSGWLSHWARSYRVPQYHGARANLRGAVLVNAPLRGADLRCAGIARTFAGVHRAGPDAVDFPAGTVLVAYGPPHGRTYFATEARWESMDFSPDGTRLILRSDDDSFVLRAADLRVVQRLPNSYAWWEGTRVGYLDGSGDGCIITGHRRLPLTIGRSEIIGADPTGRFFLGQRLVREGTVENGDTPTYGLRDTGGGPATPDLKTLAQSDHRNLRPRQLGRTASPRCAHQVDGRLRLSTLRRNRRGPRRRGAGGSRGKPAGG